MSKRRDLDIAEVSSNTTDLGANSGATQGGSRGVQGLGDEDARERGEDKGQQSDEQ